MKSFNLFFFCFLGLIFCSSQELKFNKDRTFKIVQFTDTHIVSGKKESLETIRLIENILQKENPDFVMFTGDIVTGKPAEKGWEMVLEPIVKSKTPFAVILGNHDHENDITRERIAEIVTRTPLNLNKIKNRQIADIVLEIQSFEKQNPAALLFCMDSHAYSENEKIKGYGWFKFEQIQWFREQSDFYKERLSEILPSLAFFHIPLPEYKSAFYLENNKHFGERLENECPADVNTGMFLNMVEKGNVMGTFTGHDHNNDYITSLYGIALAYGRFSGSKNTYTDTQKGARIIVLKEGERSFETWLRLEDNTMKNKVNFPNDFKKLK